MNNGERFNDAWKKLVEGNLDEHVDYYSEDVHFKDPMVDLRGRGPVKEFLGSWVESWSDPKFEILDFIDGGDRYAGRFRLVWRFTKPLRSPQGLVPPNGKTIVFEGVQVVHLRADGRATRFHTYFDQLSLLTQVGVLPAGPGAS